MFISIYIWSYNCVYIRTLSYAIERSRDHTYIHKNINTISVVITCLLIGFFVNYLFV